MDVYFAAMNINAGRKINARWALPAFALVLVALAAAPWTVSPDAQIMAIRAQFKAGSGLDLISHGRSVFAVLPRPHIRIYDVRLDEGGGAVQIEASSLRVDLGLAGLATGQVTLARTILADAIITLDPARAPILADTVVPGAAPVRQDALGEVAVTGGRLFFRRFGAESAELIADALDARLDWGRPSSPLSFAGHARLPALGDDHASARFALWAAQPDRLARGEASAITLRIDDEALQANLNGQFTLAPHPRFQGQFSSSAPSLRFAAQWFGLSLPMPGRYRDATIKGEAVLEPEVLSFPSVNLSIDGNVLDGAASIRIDGPRPLISATLAGASVNLAPMFEDLPAPVAGGQWSREIFPPAHLTAADLDLRLSASRARLGDFQVDEAALSAMLKNGRLDLSLAGASAYSGRIRARAVIAETADGFDIRGAASAERIDVAALMWDGFKRQSLTGAGRGEISFETSGNSFYELASRLDARGGATLEKGEVYGMDLGLAFRRMEKRPLTAGLDLRSGRTGFDLLTAKFSIVQGLAEVEEGVARDERITVYFSGRAHMAERTLDLHATALRTAVNADADAPQLGFSISGSWDDATLAPDALGLIHRSDAAAPLLSKPGAAE